MMSKIRRMNPQILEAIRLLKNASINGVQHTSVPVASPDGTRILWVKHTLVVDALVDGVSLAELLARRDAEKENARIFPECGLMFGKVTGDAPYAPATVDLAKDCADLPIPEIHEAK